jgi:tRNA (mo5U34)-methyltransferase
MSHPAIIESMTLKQLIDSVPHWYHTFEFAPGVITPGSRDSKAFLEALNLPQDMSGLRVLDIGARDGFFSFECERRGAAEIVAIDYVPAEQTGFLVAKQILGSNLILMHENLYALEVSKYGVFDVVLLLGVLYHLRDPLHALEIVFQMLKVGGLLYLETVVIDDDLPASISNRPLMHFYPKATKNSDPTNYWGMTESCVVAMLEECDFHARSKKRAGERGFFIAQKNPEGAGTYYGRIARGLVG